MAALDWIFVAVLLISLLIGAWRGLVFEVLSLLGWIAAFVVAQWFAGDMAVLLPMGQSGDGLRYAAGFAVVFVMAIFAFGFVAWVGKKVVEAVGLRPVDRTLGAAFGVARGLVLLLALTVVAALTPLHDAAWWQESRGAQVLAEMLRGLKPALPEEFGRHLPS